MFDACRRIGTIFFFSLIIKRLVCLLFFFSVAKHNSHVSRSLSGRFHVTGVTRFRQFHGFKVMPQLNKLFPGIKISIYWKLRYSTIILTPYPCFYHLISVKYSVSKKRNGGYPNKFQFSFLKLWTPISCSIRKVT